MTWEEIVRDPAFQALGQVEKEQVLSGYFADQVDADPEFKAAVSRDPGIRDEVWRNMYASISTPEDTWSGGLKKAIKGVPGRFVKGMGGAIRAFEEAPLSNDVTPGGRFTGDTPSSGESVIGRPLAAKGRAMAAPHEINATPGSAKWYVLTAAQSIAQNLPLLATGIVGGPALPLAGMSAQAAGEQYEELRAAGVDPNTAIPAAAGYGVAEALGETLPLSRLFKTGRPIVKRVLQAMILDVPGEMLTEALEAGIDRGTIAPDMSVNEALRRVVDAGIVSAIAGPVQYGTISGPLAAWERRVRRFRDDGQPYAGKSPGGQIGEAVEQGQDAARGIVPRDLREQVEAEDEGAHAKRESLQGRRTFTESADYFDLMRARGAGTDQALGAGLRDVFKKGPGWPGRRSSR